MMEESSTVPTVIKTFDDDVLIISSMGIVKYIRNFILPEKHELNSPFTFLPSSFPSSFILVIHYDVLELCVFILDFPNGG